MNIFNEFYQLALKHIQTHQIKYVLSGFSTLIVDFIMAMVFIINKNILDLVKLKNSVLSGKTPAAM